MAKKSKKVSVSAMDAILKSNYTPVETVEWNGVEVSIKKSLDMGEMLSFVDSVVRSCFAEATNEYRPEAKDFAVRVNIMTRYANIAMPEKAEHQYAIAVCSGVVEMIVKHINTEQFNAMMRSIDEKIGNIAAANIEMMNRKFDDLVRAFESMNNQMVALFDGVTAEDISAITSGLSEKGMTTDEGIVKAYLEQKRAGV